MAYLGQDEPVPVDRLLGAAGKDLGDLVAPLPAQAVEDLVLLVGEDALEAAAAGDDERHQGGVAPSERRVLLQCVVLRLGRTVVRLRLGLLRLRLR